jgi:glycosyltransferase involved in cell wall biosynthesis
LPDGASVLVSEEPAPLFYPGQTGRGFGWGVCNWHLMHELSRLIPVRKLEPNDPLFRSQSLPGNLFVPLGGGDFSPYSPARGRHNFGYVFFEQELQPKAREIARGLDLVFAGSTWCLKRMQEQGIANCALLIQGVDTQVFHPQAASKSEFFVLFSGGKFELRKGQDLVLKAFSILSRKYPDMVLATAWHNVWPETMKSMRASPHIRFESIQGSWVEQMEHLYRLNGIDPQRVRTMGNLRREEMAEVYRASDLGLFPNRCEGGTNLVLMEYMACGKPAIATDASGHKDVCHESNSFPLRSLRPFVQRDTNGQVVNRWVEPSLDEIIALVEDAYQHPSKARTLGEVAAADMRQWSWQRAANTIISTLGQVAGRRGA